MPGGDGTGPAGLGPMTGRAAGYCAGYPVPGFMNPIIGRGGFYRPGMMPFGPYNVGLYGYAGWIRPWFSGFLRPRFGRWFRPGRWWGRGRGRFGYWW